MYGPYVPEKGGELEVTLIVKAAPEFSKTHREVVCTAGILDDGRLVRIYPVSWDDYRAGHLPKYVRVRARLIPSDEAARRPESHKLVGKMQPISYALAPPRGRTPWGHRMTLLARAVEPGGVEGMRVQQRTSRTSLAIVRVKKLLDFHIEASPDEIIQQSNYRLDPQTSIDGQSRGTVGSRVDRLKHCFYYTWKCHGACCVPEEGRHKMQCEDWELFESYRRWRADPRYPSAENLAWALKNKYFDEMSRKDLHFALGTSSDPAHQQAPMIIGIIYPPAPDGAPPLADAPVEASEVFRPKKPESPERRVARAQRAAAREGQGTLDRF